MTEYKFEDAENTTCFTCDHVLIQHKPILFVTHDIEDGYWQFLCGLKSHEDSNAKIISLKQATEIDTTINELFEMPMGFSAARKEVKDEWQIFEATT